MSLWLEQEIEIARKDGVTHPGNNPFFLAAPKTSSQAVLLIHGFSSSPREMYPLGEHLQQQGITVAGVRLPGHGTTPEDLASRHAEEWLSTVIRGYQSLADLGVPVSIAGLSTGAVLALHLALQVNAEKLILLSPFLKLRHVLAPFANWLHYFIPYQHKNISLEEQPFYYQRRPLKGIAQVNKLCRQLEGNLGKIEMPNLTLASAGDKTIAAGTANLIYQQLGSQNKSFHFYGPEVPHVLTTSENPRQADVLGHCSAFLNN